MGKEGVFVVVLVAAMGAATVATDCSFGTVLFTKTDVDRECWSEDGAALVTAHMLMKHLMPHVSTLHADDDTFVADIIEYFRLLLESIRGNTEGKTKHIMLLAFTDVAGGYMRHMILPIAKYSYYAGNIGYTSIVKLFQLFDEIKNFLKTDGQGWAKPNRHLGQHIQARPINLQSACNSDPCKGLIFYKSRQSEREHEHEHDHDHEHEHDHEHDRFPNEKPHEQYGCSMAVPLPFFDSKTRPSAIAVPFRTFGLRNLESRVSSYILVKFYVAVNKCMASRNVRDEDVQRFSSDMHCFIMSKVMIHLSDEKFYAAFGGVLRILETIRRRSPPAKSHHGHMGNFDIVPDVETKEPFPEMMQESELGPKVASNEEKSGKSNLILLAALATIIIWFCLGAVFVCCRIRVSKMKKDEGKLCEDETAEVACQLDSCPNATNVTVSPVYSTTSPSEGGKSRTNISLRSSTTMDRVDASPAPEDTEQNKAAEIQVQSVQYYPPSFARHARLPGKFRLQESSSDDSKENERETRLKPSSYVYGYDLQTSSDDSSPRPTMVSETSDGEVDMMGNRSK